MLERTVAAVVFLWLLCLPVVAEEELCITMGSNCVCSEPMEHNKIQGTAITDALDFADSTTKECEGLAGEPFYDCDTCGGTLEDEVWMPAGNTVTHVVEIPPGPNFLFPDRSFTTEKRMCYRFYYNVPTNYSGTGGNLIQCPTERAKVSQISYSGGDGGQSQIAESSPGPSDCTGPIVGLPYPLEPESDKDYTMTYRQMIMTAVFPPTCDTSVSLSPTLSYFDCMRDGPESDPPGKTGTGGCRLEHCVGSGTGTVENGQDITFYTKITRLHDMRESTATIACGSMGGSLQGFVGADLFHSPQSGGGTARGRIQVGYFMQAAWATDSGQFIGPAVEVEEGSPSAIRGAVISDATP